LEGASSWLVLAAGADTASGWLKTIIDEARLLAVFSGLKGRFCQPRPQAWGEDERGKSRPERAIRLVNSLPNRPFRAKCPWIAISQACGLG
jgi:hypothetical protein